MGNRHRGPLGEVGDKDELFVFNDRHRFFPPIISFPAIIVTRNKAICGLCREPETPL